MKPDIPAAKAEHFPPKKKVIEVTPPPTPSRALSFLWKGEQIPVKFPADGRQESPTCPSEGLDRIISINALLSLFINTM